MDHDQDPDRDETQTDPPLIPQELTILNEFVTLIFFIQNELVNLVVFFSVLQKGKIDDDYDVDGTHQINLEAKTRNKGP